ncbi:MAG TPA: Ig-like domain-containing protein [Planctomycetota bacterium]|nr:Ig-like domain-containing protein [Planctomycetota bacterium]
MPSVASLAAAAMLAALSLPACGADAFRSTHPGPRPPGGAVVVATSLTLEPADGGSLPAVRPGSDIVLRFSAHLDEATVRSAVRVEDETRARAPVPVDASVRGRELVLRAHDAAGWRPGAVIGVRVAGLPSLRALRGLDGSTLGREEGIRVRVRAARRTDRAAPTVVETDPVSGAEGVDPGAPVVIRFSEPMDVRVLTFASRGGEEDLPVRLEGDGGAVPFRAFLDRGRRALTILPEVPFPAGAAVVLRLEDRIRDAAGNALDAATVRELRFTAAAGGESAGRIVEEFEGRDRMDPLGTTVRWDDPASPGVLEGVIEPLPIEAGAGTNEGALLLDPRGGTMRAFFPAAELGDEERTLKGLHLLVAQGGLAGEVLEPRVRVAAAAGLLPAPGDPEPAWIDATGALRAASPRGPDGAIPLPFQKPTAWRGGPGLLIEVSWKGVAGTVVLRAGLHDAPRTLLQGVDPAPTALRLAPLVRLDAVGHRAVARSRWTDSGTDAPTWQEPRLRPAAAPGACRVELQGAPAAADGSGPDTARATAWSQDPAAIEGMRWARFRVVFEGEPEVAPAAVDELTIPFVGRAPDAEPR